MMIDSIFVGKYISSFNSLFQTMLVFAMKKPIVYRRKLRQPGLQKMANMWQLYTELPLLFIIMCSVEFQINNALSPNYLE